MPRVSAERLQDRRNSIIAAARDVFATKGFNGTAIADIAKIAGTSDGLIYRYFNGKRELLEAVLDDFYGSILEEVAQAIAAAPDFRTRLQRLIEHHVAVFARDTGLCRLFITEVRNLEGYVGSDSQALNRRYTALLAPVLETGIAEGALPANIDRRFVRDMLFGGIEHIAWRHISTETPLDVPDISRKVTALLLGGMAAG
ncbi:putative TetR family transcriptional regulator [Caenibius tardaugens NBRC 16725]|uniref:Putative TetR family transcriptional regulator n=1 Tax=Caenibius tardaugens NBRC 16725 TaxID=1219035 RepID=U2Y9R9_9SPHN|nr:TetR/AcrR family transcriptional regulator [Caenibius tardaugens]GAD50081.1 putative TetR family transcriptional regulator [Caenibius tardaugens NBRC 16725]